MLDYFINSGRLSKNRYISTDPVYFKVNVMHLDGVLAYYNDDKTLIQVTSIYLLLIFETPIFLVSVCGSFFTKIMQKKYLS